MLHEISSRATVEAASSRAQETGKRQDAASTSRRFVLWRRCRTAPVCPEWGRPFSPCAAINPLDCGRAERGRAGKERREGPSQSGVEPPHSQASQIGGALRRDVAVRLLSAPRSSRRPQNATIVPVAWFREAALRACGALCRTLARLLLRGGCRLRVSGQEHVSGRQPVIILPNHRSYLDAPTVLAALPGERVRQITWGGATSVMFRSRFMRLLSRAMRVIPADIPREADSEVERAQQVAEFLRERVAELGKT